MDFNTILFQVLALFVMMGVGLFARKMGYMSDETKKGMTDILIKIVTPAVVISSFSKTFEQEKMTNAWIVLCGAIIMHLILCAFSFVLFKNETKDKRAVLRFGTIFGNFGFMGLPVLQSLFGSDGVFYGAMFHAAFYFFSWTFGVSLFVKPQSTKETLKQIFNAPFVSVVVGVIMYLSPFRLPNFLQNVVDSFGNMNTPLSMMIVGSIFADVKLKEVFSEKKIYIAAAIRLIGAPTLAMLIVLGLNATDLFDMHGIPYQVIIAEEAMPCAAYAAIFATKFGSDAKLASKMVAIATASSIITIPLIVWIMQNVGI